MTTYPTAPLTAGRSLSDYNQLRACTGPHEVIAKALLIALDCERIYSAHSVKLTLTALICPDHSCMRVVQILEESAPGASTTTFSNLRSGLTLNPSSWLGTRLSQAPRRSNLSKDHVFHALAKQGVEAPACLQTLIPEPMGSAITRARASLLQQEKPAIRLT